MCNQSIKSCRIFPSLYTLEICVQRISFISAFVWHLIENGNELTTPQKLSTWIPLCYASFLFDTGLQIHVFQIHVTVDPVPVKPLWAPQASAGTHDLTPIIKHHKYMCILYGIYCFSTNSLRPGDAYMCQWTGSVLAQVMAYRWVDAGSSLWEPMFTYR